MTQATTAGVTDVDQVEPIDTREIAPWAILLTLLTLLVIFFVGAGQSDAVVGSGNAIHEWVHDARHVMGYPCH